MFVIQNPTVGMNNAISQWLLRAILIHFPIAKVRLVSLPKGILDAIIMG